MFDHTIIACSISFIISCEVVAKVPSNPAPTANIMIVSKFCIRSDCNPKEPASTIFFYILVMFESCLMMLVFRNGFSKMGPQDLGGLAGQASVTVQIKQKGKCAAFPWISMSNM